MRQLPRPRSVPPSCIVLQMKLPTNNPALDLLKLYKSKEVNRFSTFAEVASELDSGDIVGAYRKARRSAPRRHDRNKTYFVKHVGQTNRSKHSNRSEEHLAIALYEAFKTWAPMVLPTGKTLDILDYQTPLKARQRDKGVGKIDLFGLIDARRPAVIELKVCLASGRGDTPLRAYLEALAYCAIVEANAAEIASDAYHKFEKSLNGRAPGLIVMAPLDYWSGYLEHPKAGPWWPALNGLASRIDNLLGLETHFVGLLNADFQMGGDGQDPEMIGQCSLVGVAELVGA